MAQSKKKPAKARAREEMRQAARQEAERLKAEQAAKARRRTIIWTSIGLAVAVVAAVVVILALQSTNQQSYGSVAKPLGAEDSGSIAVGQDLKPGGAPASGSDVVVVRVYSDYMCPGCASVERRLGGKLEDLAAAGEIKLELQSVSFLDRLSQGTEYSTRAANASATIAALAPEQYLAFHSKLYETEIQPAENSEGLSDERLIELAQEVGVPEDVTSQFADRKYADWVEYATSKAQAQPVETTPSIWIGPSDSRLTLIANPGTVDLDEAVAKVRAGEDPN
ncbi:MAG: thioredoxin domain-containing protein [Bifidobacteriaceae bacterium]|jgi:protein-disulfide isomerase|nr:thioredoxin domain-containing protein [Bifidobacteriaceae bacterium]